MTTTLQAATNTESADDSLTLRPPHAELPPTFWEQYGTLTIVAVVLLTALFVFFVWLLLRPKPVVLVPVEIETRHELESLRQLPEDGQVLSRVSRAVRNYFATAFELSAGELTTTEICRAIESSDKFSPDLAARTTTFLRRCDELKFAPASPKPIDAVVNGLKLLELGEERRALLRQSAAVVAAQSGQRSA